MLCYILTLHPLLSKEISRKQRGGAEKTERQYSKKVEQGGGGGGRVGGEGRLPSEKGSIILLERGEGTAHTHTLQAGI